MSDPMDFYEQCMYRFNPWFGPVLKCSRCGATTMVSMDGKSKPIFPPARPEQRSDFTKGAP